MGVSNQAGAINNASYGLFFGAIQDYAIRILMISIHNIFDSTKSPAKRLSIPGMIRQLSASKLVVRRALVGYLSLPNLPKLDDLSDSALSSKAMELLLRSRPTRDSSPELRRIVDYRSRLVAHREYAVTATEVGARFEDAEWCLKWAKKFLIMISDAYLNTHSGNDVDDFFTNSSALRTSMSMQRILEDLDVVTARYPEQVLRRRKKRRIALQAV